MNREQTKLVVKESSDEMNPAVLERARGNWNSRRDWRAGDYCAVGVATCGVGFMPVAPGTWGSLVGVGIYLLVRSASAEIFVRAQARGWTLPPLEALRISFVLCLLTVLFVAGIRAATRTEKLTGRKDPGMVVIDEVVGQLITYLFIPFNAGWRTLAVGFFAFRAFDIIKPYPANRLESLESGLGIMADDVMAGFYAATLLSLLTSLYLLFN